MIKLGILSLFTVAVLVGSALLIRHVRVAKEREETHWAVKGVLVNLSNYSDWQGRLPPPTITDPEGKPLSSWRFATAAILLGDPVQTGYYGQHAYPDKPWDGPENQRYLSGPYREYIGSPLSYIDQSRPGNKARFVAVVGSGTAFDENVPHRMDQLPGGLILVTEVRGCTAHWMQPGGDLDVRAIPPAMGVQGGIGPASGSRAEFYLGFADKSVWLVRTDVPFEDLAKFFTISGAKQHDREAVLGPYLVKVWR